MQIRKARNGDEKCIAEVIISTWKSAYLGIVPDDFLAGLTTDKHETLFKQKMAEDSECIFVLENEEKKIVGMVFGDQDKSGEYDSELVAIYILPAYQKLGYGKCLFSALIEVFKEKGYKSLLIWTFEENKDRAFYEKLGGIAAKKMSYRFGEKNIALTGYTWQNINDITLSSKHEGGLL